MNDAEKIEYTDWLRRWKTDADIQTAYEIACEDRDVDRIDIIVMEAKRRSITLL